MQLKNVQRKTSFRRWNIFTRRVVKYCSMKHPCGVKNAHNDDITNSYGGNRLVLLKAIDSSYPI